MTTTKDWKHGMGVVANHLLAQCVGEAAQNDCSELEITVIVSHAGLIAMATTIEPPQQAALFHELNVAATAAVNGPAKGEGN